MNSNNKGFTLVELLAVIVVLALIMVIAIPSILKTTNEAKKEAFYLYAESLQSKAIAKYTQDIDLEKGKTDCTVYDIEEDLDLSNTGDYEGWVKVTRKATNKGKRVAEIILTNENGIKAAYYGISTSPNSCIPNEPVIVPEGSKKINISQTLEPGQVLCAKYDYINNNKIVSSSKVTKSYDSIPVNTDKNGNELVKGTTYDYEVRITLKNRDHHISDALFNKKMTKADFYALMDEQEITTKVVNGKVIKGKTKDISIKAPTCSTSDSSEVKGTTVLKTTIVNNTTTKDKGTHQVQSTTPKEKGTHQVESTTSKEKGTHQVESTTTTNKIAYVTTTTTANKGIHEVTSTATYTKTTEIVEGETTTRGVHVATTNTNPEMQTVTYTTTTVDVTDESNLLSSLNLSGYDIGFDPYKFYYEITVPNSQTSVGVNASPKVSGTNVVVSGNEYLGIGTNSVVVALANPNTGSQSQYTVFVRRVTTAEEAVTKTQESSVEWDPQSGKPDPKIEASDASLMNLSVSGYELEFDPTIYDYTLEFIGEDKLSINAVPNNNKAKVTIEGNEHLEDGNQIVITVLSENQYYSKTYTITVKLKKEEKTTTKILKYMTVLLSIALVIILIVIYYRKKGTKLMNRQIDVNNTNNNN